MTHLTAREVLSQVDALLPNQYTAAEKLRWLEQAEGFVKREILQNTAEIPGLTTESVLSVPAPYDEMYRHYIEAQIHYANAEMSRYNNASTAWNNAFLTYRDYYCRTVTPPSAARALRFC